MKASILFVCSSLTFVLAGILGCTAELSPEDGDPLFSAAIGSTIGQPPPLPPEPLIHFEQLPTGDFTTDAETKPFPSERTTSDGRLTFRYKRVPRANASTSDLKEQTNCLLVNQVEPDTNGELHQRGCSVGDPNILDIDQLVPNAPVNPGDPEREIYMPFNLSLCNAPRPDGSSNPYACDGQGIVNSNHSLNVYDCYDLGLVYTSYIEASSPRRYRLRGRQVTVVVDNPKTHEAEVHTIVYDSGGHAASAYPANDPSGTYANLSEPTITADGRLIILHEGNIGRGLRYSYIPEGEEPCDVTAWDDFQSIAGMYQDPDLDGVYKLAEYPLRDFENAPFSPTDVINGQYPWVDPDGSMLLFTYANRSLFYCEEGSIFTNSSGKSFCTLKERFNTTIDDSNSEDFDNIHAQLFSWTYAPLSTLQAINQRRLRQGMTMAGFWSRGKLVSVDSRINGNDYAIASEYRVSSPLLPVGTADIYANHSGVGFGASDMVFFNSAMNFYNAREEYRPRSPQDVVWLVSNTIGTDEIAFDDYLNEYALIVMNGTAVISGDNQLLDGWHTSIGGQNPVGTGWIGSARLENSATAFDSTAAATVQATQRFAIPPHAELADSARVEPISQGGVKGKGVFLDADGSHFLYRIPPQPQAGTSLFASGPWYTSFYINPTEDIPAGLSCKLMVQFPDGSYFGFVSDHELCYGTAAYQTLDLEAYSGQPGPLALDASRWSHFGLESDGTNFKIFVNGYLFHSGTFSGPGKLFTYGAGTQEVVLQVGGDAAAWLDEFKVIARSQLPEMACNHAGGTLVEVDDEILEEEILAGAYPGHAHDDIGTASYFCEMRKISGNSFIEPGDDAYACLGKTRLASADPRCVGLANLLGTVPELQFDEPRPDATTNAFCLSCHSGNWMHPAMNVLDALAAGAPDTPAWQDPRRQPLQPASQVHGYVPEGFFGGQNRGFVSLAEGVSVDVLSAKPDALYVYKVTESGSFHWIWVVNAPEGSQTQSVNVEWRTPTDATILGTGTLFAVEAGEVDFVRVTSPAAEVAQLRVQLDGASEYSQWIDVP